MRVTRAEMLEALHKDYIATARSKGLAERIVIVRHALRNALLPVLTLIGMSMGRILSGAVLVETVFAWPGIGRYLIHSIHVRDFPAVMAVTVIASIAVLLANLATDIAYAFADPRIRYEET
jgi:peptide/nickel transport system permease protein